VAVTLHGADEGDTATIQDTVAEAGERIATVVAHSDLDEAIQQLSAEGLREIPPIGAISARVVVSEASEMGLLGARIAAKRLSGQEREQQAARAERI
jgi:hypothetical protein